jgi:hypothetical protein
MFTPDTCPTDLREALERLSAAVTTRETAALKCAGHRSWTPTEWARNYIEELETATVGGILVADVRRLLDLVTGLAESAALLQQALTALGPVADLARQGVGEAPDRAHAAAAEAIAVPREVFRAAGDAHAAITEALASAEASARQSREVGPMAGGPRPVGAIA